MKTETALKRIEALVKASVSRDTGTDPEDIKVDFNVDLLDRGGVRLTVEEAETSTQIVTYGSLVEALASAVEQAGDL